MAEPAASARPFRIVVAGHRPFAEALVGTADGIVGTGDGLTALTLDPVESPELFATRVEAAIAAAEAPVLLLTDLVGGSPHNVVAAAMQRAGAWCIGGANLAVLLEAVTTREPLSDQLVERLVRLGRDALVAVAARG
ncbi:MAG: PTS sugar transporter subunit IIA [Candidatus Limnocylindria bacterium]